MSGCGFGAVRGSDLYMISEWVWFEGYNEREVQMHIVSKEGVVLRLVWVWLGLW